MSLPTIGFVGVGNMGRPMVDRLRDAGYAVVAHDRDAAALTAIGHPALRGCASPAEVAGAAETVFLSLPTPDIVERVCSELMAGARATRIVDLSTTGPAISRAVARTLAAHDITLVDCPVSGGVAGAIKGSLALMVGASAADLASVRSMLECFGRVFHVGLEPGMGQMMKVINNLMSASALAASAEGVAMAMKAGLEPGTVIEVLNAGSGRSSATLDKFPRQILPGTFDAGFSIGLMVKDVNLCMAQAEQMGLDLPSSRTVATIWAMAAERIGPDADFTRIVELAEAAAGVRMSRRKAAAADA